MLCEPSHEQQCCPVLVRALTSSRSKPGEDSSWPVRPFKAPFTHTTGRATAFDPGCLHIIKLLLSLHSSTTAVPGVLLLLCSNLSYELPAMQQENMSVNDYTNPSCAVPSVMQCAGAAKRIAPSGRLDLVTRGRSGPQCQHSP